MGQPQHLRACRRIAYRSRWRRSFASKRLLKEALAKHGGPEIFNTDQGSRFTGNDFTSVPLDAKSPSAWTARAPGDNVFVERLWRSVKYEEVCLRAYDSVSEAREPRRLRRGSGPFC